MQTKGLRLLFRWKFYAIFWIQIEKKKLLNWNWWICSRDLCKFAFTTFYLMGHSTPSSSYSDLLTPSHFLSIKFNILHFLENRKASNNDMRTNNITSIFIHYNLLSSGLFLLLILLLLLLILLILLVSLIIKVFDSTFSHQIVIAFSSQPSSTTTTTTTH